MARESALNYTRSLPDFICTEVVRRYNDTRSRLLDTLTLKLSYFEQKEKYQLLAINGRATVLPYESVGGVITQGEFGSLLAEVFDRQSAAEFRWDHWTTLRQRPAQVYSFRVLGRPVPLPDPGRRPRHARRDSGRTARLCVRGWRHQPDGSHFAEADGIPRDFPVLKAATVLDYDFVEIGGRQFLLPLHADARMTTAQMRITQRGGVPLVQEVRVGCDHYLHRKTMTSEWNPGLYESSHSFVWEYGRDLIGLLAPEPGERILDVGCGTGQLTAEIARRGAQVVGIDQFRSP